jgi:hypothetical protein
MENNTHYTPKIEEFHVGFPYEITDGYEWVKKVFCHEDFNTFLYKHLDNAIKQEYVRVKYLDSDDIKSIPLYKTNKDQCYGFEDYYSGDVNPNYGYFLYYTLHVPKLFNKSNKIEENLFKIILHRYYNETTNINEQVKNGESKVVFEGLIKNISKLKSILKDLRIIG